MRVPAKEAAKIYAARKESKAMTTQDLNRRFAGLCGLCWHEIVREPYICSCGEYCETERAAYWHINNSNPDFCEDPRLVLEVMMKREDWPHFQMTLFRETAHGRIADCIPIIYIKDTTGMLALKAIEWMELQKQK